jgi:thymidylate synthase ThyX
MLIAHHVEAFTDEERSLLERHVTSVDGPVFALVDLPETTRAALFARYSRSRKSLRRLLLDEFSDGLDPAAARSSRIGEERARDLFSRVLADYGDDSVAQLAGVHLACEQVSQLLAKAIEWGRLMGYLEQSTRYIAYTDRRDGQYRYHLDPAIETSDLSDTYHAAMDGLFDAYCAVIEPLREHLDRTLPAQDDAKARTRAIRALALDIARALLPAGTVSNVGVFGSPQAYEQLVLRLRAHPLPEARAYAEVIATELRKVIPDFLTRLDRPDRGGVWVDYLAETAASLADEARRLGSAATQPQAEAVRLLRWDPDGEERIR